MVSVLVSFAKFLERHHYSTSMWEKGYRANDVNEVCHHLSKWVHSELALPGELIMIWSRQEGTNFSGDSELAYLQDDVAYLLPNPFIERDLEGFVVALQTILSGDLDELYETPIHKRVLYNAV